MTTTFYKDKVIRLQQELDEKDDEIKRLNNELLLCKEVKKEVINEYPKELSKGQTTTTPMIEFESPDVATILKGRIKSMKMYTRKKR